MAGQHDRMYKMACFFGSAIKVFVFIATICTVAVITLAVSGNTLMLKGDRVQKVSSIDHTLPFGDQSISMNKLPSLLTSSTVQDASAVEKIRNTLALYALAVDGKAFEVLNTVFVQDVVANYSGPISYVSGLPDLKEVLKQTFAPVTSQHNIGTQVIELTSPHSAVSVSYVVATHFGTGSYIGELLTDFGQYQDQWEQQENGSWRITHRNMILMGPFVGNPSIFNQH